MIYCHRPSWAITAEVVTRVPRIAATTTFRIMIFFLPLMDLVPSQQSQFDQTVLAECCRRGLDSVTMPRPITPSGPVKHRNGKIANTATNSNGTTRASYRPCSNHEHYRRPDPGRDVWCC